MSGHCPADDGEGRPGSLGSPAVVTDSPPKCPRVSKNVERRVEIVLGVLWLAGSAYLLEVQHTGWAEQVILLVVVVVLEVVFVIWNRGGVKAAADADKKPSAG